MTYRRPPTANLSESLLVNYKFFHDSIPTYFEKLKLGFLKYD